MRAALITGWLTAGLTAHAAPAADAPHDASPPSVEISARATPLPARLAPSPRAHQVRLASLRVPTRPALADRRPGLIEALAWETLRALGQDATGQASITLTPAQNGSPGWNCNRPGTQSPLDPTARDCAWADTRARAGQ